MPVRSSSFTKLMCCSFEWDRTVGLRTMFSYEMDGNKNNDDSNQEKKRKKPNSGRLAIVEDSDNNQEKKRKKPISGKLAIVEDSDNPDILPVQMQGVGSSNVILIVVNKEKTNSTVQVSSSISSALKDTLRDDLGENQITEDPLSLPTDTAEKTLQDASIMGPIEEIDEPLEETRRVMLPQQDVYSLPAMDNKGHVSSPMSGRKEYASYKRPISSTIDGKGQSDRTKHVSERNERAKSPSYDMKSHGSPKGEKTSGSNGRVRSPSSERSPSPDRKKHRSHRSERSSRSNEGGWSPPSDRKKHESHRNGKSSRPNGGAKSPMSDRKTGLPESDRRVQPSGYEDSVEDLQSSYSFSDSDISLLSQIASFSPWGPPHRTLSGLQGLNLIDPGQRLQADISCRCFPVPKKHPDAIQDSDCNHLSSVSQGNGSLGCNCRCYCPCTTPCVKTVSPCFLYSTFPICCFQPTMCCQTGNGYGTGKPREERGPLLNMNVVPCASDHFNMCCCCKSMSSVHVHDYKNACNRIPQPMGQGNSCNKIPQPMGHDNACNRIPHPMGHDNACNRIPQPMGHDNACNRIPQPMGHDNTCYRISQPMGHDNACNRISQPMGHDNACNRIPQPMGHENACNRIPQPMGHENACNRIPQPMGHDHSCNRIPQPMGHDNACKGIPQPMGFDEACFRIPPPETFCCSKLEFNEGSCTKDDHSEFLPSFAHTKNRKKDVQSRPPTVICYICGQEFGTASVEIHEKKCLERWRTENNRLPVEEQRSEPVKPNVPDDKRHRSRTAEKPGKDIHRRNEAALESIQQRYVKCHKCNRTFLPDRLKIHLKGCMGFHSVVPQCKT